MIAPINITGINYKVSSAAQEYAVEKIGKLGHFILESLRGSVSADVKFERVDRNAGDMILVSVVLHLPGKTLTAEDEQLTEPAAIDVVQEKLAGQLRRYKTAKTSH